MLEGEQVHHSELSELICDGWLSLPDRGQLGPLDYVVHARRGRQNHRPTRHPGEGSRKHHEIYCWLPSSRSNLARHSCRHYEASATMYHCLVAPHFRLSRA